MVSGSRPVTAASQLATTKGAVPGKRTPCSQGNKFHAAGRVARNAKGALGQALVQKYFEYAGWAVAPTGVEVVVDHIMHQAGLDTGALSKLPDFIVSKAAGSKLNPSTHPLGQAFYVEVKTWAGWPGEGVDMAEYLRFGTVMLVFVGPAGLRATWLTRPPGDGKPIVAANPACVLDSDFAPLEHVGTVSMEHCPDDACEQRVRESFDTISTALASLGLG